MNVDQVIRIVATKGPIIPIQISKELETNTTMAGAMLSQLVDQKRVFVSKVKVGGSPLYYIKGQEIRLQEYSKNLNEKDLRAFELLKENKILRDGEQSPLNRVCLRNIKDFAVPLEVTFGEEKEIFWKWFLLNDEDARELIGSKLKVAEKIREENKIVAEKIEVPVEIKKDSDSKLQTFVKEEPPLPKPTPTPIPEPKKEEIKEVEEPEEEPVETLKTNDVFVRKIINYLNGKGIIVTSFDIKRKNSEVDLHLLVPSAVGQIQYYCKAKNKKRVNDGDISSTFVQGQLKKMPAMFLTTGELTKKAAEMLEKEIKISIIKM